MSRYTAPVWLDESPQALSFPPVARALEHPNGLLAVGGDLSPQRLLAAYRQGIFPWYGPDQPILWWSPDPRLVLFPEEMRVARSLRRTQRRRHYRVSFDTAFARVIRECAGPRRDQDGTWLVQEMIEAYCDMHRLGWAHSIEIWDQKELVGGVYGLAIGGVFFGESMFSRRPDTSKLALWYLVRHLQAWGYAFLDCQVRTEHLVSLGAREIPRDEFIERIGHACTLDVHPTWQCTLSPQD